MALIRALRSLIAILSCLFVLGVIAPLALYLIVLPLTVFRPQRRQEAGVRWVNLTARCLVWLCKAGGATFEIEGEIDCAQPGVVIMNHQSVLEIAPLILVLRPRLPRFVARARYAKWIPTVSPAIRFLDCIVVDPRRDRAGAVLAMQRAAQQELRHSVMLFPEGHRTMDGEIAPFRPAGLTALLEVRQIPVRTVVSDGFWHFRRVTDTFFGLGSVKGRLRVVEEKMSPENPGDLPAFIEDRRQNMIRELARMRAEAAP